MELYIQPQDYDNCYSFILVSNNPGGRSIVTGLLPLAPWEDGEPVDPSDRHYMSKLEMQALCDQMWRFGFRATHDPGNSELKAVNRHLNSEITNTKALLKLILVDESIIQEKRAQEAFNEDTGRASASEWIERIEHLDVIIQALRSRLSMYEENAAGVLGGAEDDTRRDPADCNPQNEVFGDNNPTVTPPPRGDVRGRPRTASVIEERREIAAVDRLAAQVARDARQAVEAEVRTTEEDEARGSEQTQDSESTPESIEASGPVVTPAVDVVTPAVRLAIDNGGRSG